MPRVYHIKKTRKDQGPCGSCGKEIKKGDPYLFWEFRFGGRRVRCTDPACAPRPKDLTNSEFLSTLYGIQETDFSGPDNIDDLASMVDEVKSDLETLRDEQEDKRSNMPEQLQESDTGNMLQERYDALDEAINNLDGVDLSFDEPEKEEKETDEKFKERFEEALNDRLQELADELNGYLQEISV